MKLREKKENSTKKSAVRYLLFGTAAMVVLLLGLTFLYNALISSFGSEILEEGRNYSRHFVLIADTSDSDFWEEAYAAMLEEGENYDAYVEMKAFDKTGSFTLSDLMEMSIASGADGILLEYEEEEGLDEKIEEASSSGIPVVTLVSDAPNSGRVSYAGVNPYIVAELYTGSLLGMIGEDHKPGDEIRVAVILTEQGTDTNQHQIFTQIHSRLSEKIGTSYRLSTESVNVTTEDIFSYEQALRRLFRSSHVPDYIVAMDSAATDTAYQIIIDYNAVDKTRLLGAYLSDTTSLGIQNHVIKASMLMDADELGRSGVTALGEYLSEGYTNSYYNIDAHLVTEEELP